MKTLFSILLLLITSIYVLPVKEIISDGFDVCLTDVEDEKENSKKKEKEFFSFSNSYIEIQDAYPIAPYRIEFDIPDLLHTVETPPPDFS